MCSSPNSPVERHLTPANREPDDVRRVDLRIADLAATQHGVVARSQLLALGVGSSAISRRVASARLHRIHQAVYAVGHVGLSREGRWMAAVLACGPGSALAGRAAGALWNISRFDVDRVRVLSPRRRPGIRAVDLRLAGDLSATHTIVRDSILVLKVHRLLLDLGRDLTQWQLANVLHEAAFRRVLVRDRIDELVQVRRNARGMAVLRQALALHDAGSAGSTSPLEDEFLRLILAARFPIPEVNAFVQTPGGRYRVDFVWRRRRLCIETDGRDSHQRLATKLEDDLRDEHLTAAGFRVVRFSGRQVWGEPFGVMRRLEALLS